MTVAFGLGVGIGWLGSARRHRDRTQRRFARGRGAERDALRELGRLGFDVLATQHEGQAHVVVDGRRIDVPVRVDYLVRRRGRRALVEVKSGDEERDPTDVSTRRQLLEYWVAFPGMRLYHLDTVTGSVQRIRFRYRLGPRMGWRLALVIAVGAAAGTAVSLATFLR